MTSQLEEALDTSRREEMDRFGRVAAYYGIEATLSGDRLRAFQLVNHGLTLVDDVLDRMSQPLEYLEHIRTIFHSSFSGALVGGSTSEEQAVIDLGHTLDRLASARFPRFTDRAIGKHTYKEVLNYWELEAKNFQRQWQILDRESLNEITSGIGGIVASQFLFILDPPSDPYGFVPLANTHGLAVKLADNLCDFREDIRRGFVNIPLEEIHHVQGIRIHNDQVIEVDPDALALSMEYMKKEYGRIQRVFDSADNLLLRTRLNRPVWNRKLHKRLRLFGRLCHAWRKQAQEFMAIETLRSYEHPDMRLVTSDEIHDIEQKYGVSVRDVLGLSYHQEARNSGLVRSKKDQHYNPYWHPKTPEANERIRALIPSGIEEVLDLGCDNGERTIDLYEGRALHGIELIEMPVNEARQKGIHVYRGSMIDDIYRDDAHPHGRTFDLVSLIGEMVNFVGPDADALLERAVEQVSDGGYLLVTCMHHTLGESEEGKYVIWSHTRSTQGKWLLDEKKIPRAFLLLSENGLQKRLDKLSEDLGCKLSLQNKDTVGNYYENTPLSIYLFRKKP